MAKREKACVRKIRQNTASCGSAETHARFKSKAASGGRFRPSRSLELKICGKPHAWKHSLCVAHRADGWLSPVRTSKCLGRFEPTARSLTFTLLCTTVSFSRSFYSIWRLILRSYGSNFAIYPTLTAELFGATTAGPNYGLVFMGYGLGSFVGMLCLAGLSGSNQVFLACAAFNFVGAFSVALLWERRRRHNMMTS